VHPVPLNLSNHAVCQQSYERLIDNIISSHSYTLFLHFPLSFSHSLSSYTHTPFYFLSALYILGTEYCKAGRSVKSGLTDLLDRVGLQSGLFGAVPPTPVSGPSGAYNNTATGTGAHTLYCACHAMMCYDVT
jgi:hypothetical protein